MHLDKFLVSPIRGLTTIYNFRMELYVEEHVTECNQSCDFV